MRQIPDEGITHGGGFHADDVFSSALLRILNPNIRILRGAQVPPDYPGIVFDTGRGAFDHHQEDAPVRENGIPYAAFGLLWRKFGESILGAHDAAVFDESFIQPLDKDDNDGSGNAIAAIISAFNPGWDEQGDRDGLFEEAVSFAKVILEKKFASILCAQRAWDFIRPQIANMQDGIMILSRYAPFKKQLGKTGAKFVIYPSNRGGYSAQAVPAADDTGALKCAFPDVWRGKEAEDLVKASGIVSLRFCHNSGFLIAADTLEDAVLACKRAQGLC